MDGKINEETIIRRRFWPFFQTNGGVIINEETVSFSYFLKNLALDFERKVNTK